MHPHNARSKNIIGPVNTNMATNPINNSKIDTIINFIAIKNILLFLINLKI